MPYWVLQRLNCQQWHNTKPPTETLFSFTQHCIFFFFLTVSNSWKCWEATDEIISRKYFLLCFCQGKSLSTSISELCFYLGWQNLKQYIYKNAPVNIFLYHMEFTLAITLIKIICPGLVLCVTLYLEGMKDWKITSGQIFQRWHLSNHFS